jgi:nucleoid-associated protein YgaU
MAMIRTDSYSRFSATDVITYDDPSQGPQTVFGPWKRPSVLTRTIPDDQITRYTVPKEREGRPDLIAFDAYGVSELDWLVIAFNNATQVFNWPKVGQTIKLPKSVFIAAELL